MILAGIGSKVLCGGANVMMNMIYWITSNNTKETNTQINKYISFLWISKTK